MSEENEFSFNRLNGKELKVIKRDGFIPPEQTEDDMARIKKILDSGTKLHACYNPDNGIMITYFPS